ncbi:MAG TPA: hypothetical protein IAA21_04580 [Candidatus Blautia faecigallinarum]|uniref:Uncharacterized protein n=1 Tax=Candidatus Blautia faecigallinarum TaxID=2838488 RepID=A0A9D2DRZ4_9FIRM|nr:hypothetical protein [Candidatus Blautia faecigallinarum]
MAVAEDYLLRSIQDLSRLISTLLLGKDRVDFEDLEDGEEKQKQLYQRLVSMADEGDINDAENLLSEEMEDNDKTYLELALSFYLYLNEFDDDFLDDHDYSREEILDGIRMLGEDWGITGIANLR